MTKTLFKDALRSVTANRLKFISLVIIISLGVSFFVGIKSASPEMRKNANDYFESTNLLDVRVTSPIAFTDEDIAEIQKLNDVDTVVKSQYIDGLAVTGENSIVDINGAEMSCRVRPLDVVKAQAFTSDGIADNSYMNRLSLESGRYPEKKGECVIDSRAEKLYDGMSLGGTVMLTGDSESIGETLASDKFVIVGIVSSPMYISTERGNTTVGSGTLGMYIYVNEDDFATKDTNELFIKIKNSENYDKFSDEYNDVVTDLSYSIQKMSVGLIDAKLYDLKQEYSQKISDKKAEIEAYSATGQQQLDNKKKEIDEFKAYVESEDAILSKAKEDSESSLQSAKTQLSKQQNEFNTLNTTHESNVKIYDNKSSEIKGFSELKKMYDDLNAKHNNDANSLATLKSASDNAYSVLNSKKSDVNKFASSVSTYESSVNSYNSTIKSLNSDISGYNSSKETINSKINSLQNDINSISAEIETLEAKVSDGTITSAERFRLTSCKLSLSSKQSDLKDAKAELTEINNKIASANNSIKTAQNSLSSANSALVSAKASLAQSKNEQTLAQSNYDNAVNNYNSYKTTFDADTSTLNKYMSSMNQLTAGQTDLNNLSKKIAEEAKQLDELKITLTQAQIKYSLLSKNSDLEITKAQYDLNIAKGKYSTIDEEYTKLQTEINKKTDDLNGDLKKLNKLLLNADSITWEATSQTKLTGHESFISSLENVRSMSTLFPIIFIVTAMIACLAIMIKSIENDRNEIGLFKAVGYSNASIQLKYLVYTGLACLSGTAIGIVVGSCLLPRAIYSIYSIVYTIPKIGIVFNAKYILYGLLIAVGTSFVATIIACIRELRFNPATLIRPKTIYYNKRTLLEHFPDLWERMSYGMIFIARAISRSRKRVVAETIGIACCAALVLSAFGLANSATGITASQYGKDGIFKYDMQVLMNSPQGEDSDTLAQMKSDKRIENSILMSTTTVVGSGSTDVESLKQNVHVIVPQNIKEVHDFVNLRAISGSNNLEDGTLISQKFAEDIGANVGSTIYLTDVEGAVHPTKVAGIVENYINNYVYFSPENYEDVFLSAPEYKYIISTYKDYVDGKKADEISTEYLKLNDVLGVASSDDMAKSVDASIDRVIEVVIIFIVSACLLAIIVMYTVSNISIDEREREIANIKVVGFSDSEVLIYVSRENIISSVFGIVFGLIGGIFIHKALMNFISVDSIMYNHSISWWSFIVTIFIVLLVELISIIPIKLKINNINMSESLKLEE